ncbi:MAG: sugar phosphate isomerase/epimerase family protein [Tepidiformaceae bacterium]
MKPLALSTMYAQQPRFEDGAAFARYAAAAGYDAIEISHSTHREKLQQIIDIGVLPISSVHQPAPWLKHGDGRGNSHLNLASIHPIERRAAVEYARASIGWAARIGVRHVVVHLGAVWDENGMFPEELQMRQMFDAGRAAEEQFAKLRKGAIERRALSAGPFLAAARHSLLELLQVAGPHGITIGIENRYHYHEIPLPDEYDALLEGLTNDQAGHWHDTGHAEVLHRLGFVDRHAWLDRLSTHTVGAHLHDVLGIGDHRAPGHGDVDWGYISAGLQHLPRYTLEINQHEPDDLVSAAPAFLAGVGLR